MNIGDILVSSWGYDQTNKGYQTMTNYLTTKELAAQLGLSEQRIRAKLKAGHFPRAIKCTCKQAWLIPEADNKYKPDKVSHPGETLRELLKEKGISPAKLASIIDIPADIIRAITSGKAAITKDIAIKLTKVLEVSAEFWLAESWLVDK